MVWRLRSVQPERDLLPAGPKLKSLQWDQVVLLERLGLLAEVHHNDDQASRFLRSTLNCQPFPTATQQTALNNSIPKKKEAKALKVFFLYDAEKIRYFVYVYNVYSMWTDFIQLGLLQLNKKSCMLLLKGCNSSESSMTVLEHFDIPVKKSSVYYFTVFYLK